MKSDTKKAKELMINGSFTCVLCLDGKEFTSRERGVKPLLDFISAETDFKGFCTADRIVGNAAAFLYVLLGVSEVYAEVMSEKALNTLLQNGITPIYETLTGEIRNRKNDGICPMEDAVKNCKTAEEALAAIKIRLSELK